VFTADRLFGPAAVSSGTGLVHEPFLDRARADRLRGDDASARCALGAYLVARLVDAWLELEDDAEASEEARQGYTWQLESTNRYIGELDPDRPETRHLKGTIEALRATDRGRAAAAIRQQLTAYGFFLEQDGRLPEALDVIGLAGRVYRGAIPPADFTVLALTAGRLLRLQARWEEATEMYGAAEAAASAVNERAAVLRSRLGQANVIWGQGNLPRAREEIEQIINQADTPELEEVRCRAYADLAVVLELQGLRIDALEANYQAVRLARDPLLRMRMLGDLGVKLSHLGHYEEARLAFEIVVSANASFVVRTNAQLELMELESVVGNRVSFERHRHELAECASRMPPSMAIDYRYKVGVGFARFGRLARARAAWEEARELAQEHGLNEWYFRLDRMLRYLDGCAACVAPHAGAEPTAVPQAVARVAAGLREYAELAPA